MAYTVMFIPVEFFQAILNFMRLFFAPCSEDPVPESKHIANVGVGLLLLGRMVYLVPAGCCKNQTCESLEPAGKANIAVLQDQ